MALVNTMAYSVKIEKFEGPLDLLLDLIKKQKLQITEISISHVADQFLEYVEENRDIDAENLSDFLVVAAKLLFIKSKALLPIAEIEDEEEASIEELEFRLREYNRFKKISEKIGTQFMNDNIVFQKQFMLRKIPVFYPGDNATAENLQNTLKNLISYFEKQEVKKEKKIEKIISISEKIFQIRSFLKNEQTLNFSALLKRTTSKIDIVVTFLALLELVKEQDVVVQQRDLFSEIVIEKIV